MGQAGLQVMKVPRLGLKVLRFLCPCYPLDPLVSALQPAQTSLGLCVYMFPCCILRFILGK